MPYMLYTFHTATTNADGTITTKSTTGSTNDPMCYGKASTSTHLAKNWHTIFGRCRKTRQAVITVILDGNRVTDEMVDESAQCP